jgi:hypothetical protein
MLLVVIDLVEGGTITITSTSMSMSTRGKGIGFAPLCEVG